MELVMYWNCKDGTHDFDLAFLRDLCALLDSRLDQIQETIDASFDPDQMGHFDDFEYVVGMGFVACQRYLASTFGPHNVAKKAALSVGPRHSGGETLARILNAAANYWKHSDEWDSKSTVFRNHAGLEPMQLETIRVVETVTPWGDYTCANLLAALTAPDEPRLQSLLPEIEEWRDSLDCAATQVFQR
jgi:hypothetical protein